MLERNWRYFLVHVSLLLASCFWTAVDGKDQTSSTQSNINDAFVLKIIETEVWDAPSNSWKAVSGDQRWTNERGQISKSPSEIEPPETYLFDGDWKIVVSGNDAMGWEYIFHYLQAPRRQRVWLRSLKQKPQKALAPKRPDGALSRTMSRIKDDYNFKGFNIRVYKSLVSWESMGIGVGLPMTMNFDFWDRNPGLPSISSSVGLYFPLTLVAALSTSVRVEWLRWLVKSILFVLPRILTLLVYRFILPSVWAVATALLLPMGTKIPPLPPTPTFSVSRPRYNAEISERLGCSLSYRWSRRRGFEWRLNYWHSYLPTFTIYRQLMRMTAPSDWWQKHFGSLGLSSGYPLPLPPHFSCSACLGLSGLYFKNQNVPAVSPVEDSGKTKLSLAAARRETAAAAAETKEDREDRIPPLPPPPKLAVSSHVIS